MQTEIQVGLYRCQEGECSQDMLFAAVCYLASVGIHVRIDCSCSCHSNCNIQCA
jgi:hypothetical protein